MIKSPTDLARLPLLEKETVRRHFAELVSDEYRQGGKKAIAVHTSGTTGKALRLKISIEAWQREYAFRDNHRTWMGIKPNDRIATLAGHPVVSTNHLKPPFWRRNRAENQTIFSAQHLTPETIPHYVEQLHSFQPHLLHGYPSALYLLALYLDAQNIQALLRPRAVYTHSETLLDNQRALLKRVFGCQVFDGYGNTERVAYIVECEQGSLHVRMEHSVIEFLRADGELARAGEMAEMVCTGFGNEAMPLVRYRVGDSAIYTDRLCPCGRGGTIVEKILGRVDDIIVTPDGRHVGRLDHVFKDLLNVVEAQIVQERIDAVLIRLVRRPEFGAEDMKTLERELRIRLGTKMRLEYEFLERIPREANGKFRAVISRVALSIT